MPINPNDIVVDRIERKGLNPANIEKDSERPIKYASEMIGTIKRLAEVVPAFETAANLATSSYGVPISGLVGLALLPFGTETASNTIKAIQKFMVYQPQTEGGQQLTEAAAYPMKKLDELGEYASDKIENPIVGSVVHGAIDAAPALFGGGRTAPKLNTGFPKAVEYGINKGIRPSVTKKEVYGQREKYMKNAEIAVDEIIQNKENLKLTDPDGNLISGKLPETLNEFNQAINQTKNDIFTKYDELSKTADNKGASVPMQPIVSELDGVVNNRVLQTMSPETISYANSRKSALEGQSFSTQEAQQMIQILNQSEKAYYANPTPELKGKAYVDGLIANNLRVGLDAAVEGATGIEYQPLKQKYGALRMLETDVTKRAIVDARKNIKGLIDFSDIFSSSQVVQGLMSQQPAILASGMTVKLMSSLYRKMNDPNTSIKKMFVRAEKNTQLDYSRKQPITPGFAFSAIAGRQENQEGE